jgi:predicted AlkP superfamily phosphohydrolase/phosphomutase
MSDSLFFLGIDSATWDFIIPWAKQGKLPGFAKLLSSGQTLNLDSTIPPLTPMAWTSLYTGVNAGRHNIYDFYRITKDKKITINLANNNKMPTIFEILSRHKKKIAVLNLPFTYPVRPVKGVMLSGFLTPGLETDFIYPQSLAAEFAKKFPSHAFTESARYGMDKNSQTAFFQELVKSVRDKIKVFDWVEQFTSWDLFAVNFMEVDHVQHWFYQEPEKILPVYQAVDRYLSSKLKQKKYGQIMVFSDHGAGPYKKNLNLNTCFLQKGLLKLKRAPAVRLKKLLFDLGLTPSNVAKLALWLNRLPSSKKGRSQAQKIKFFLELSDIDWTRSTAFAFGYYGNVYLLKKDKKSYQRVKQAMFELKDSGRPVIDKIWNKQEVYSGPYTRNAPDLLYSAGNYAYGASAISPFLNNRIFSAPHTLKSGEHRPKGIFALAKKRKIQPKKKDINIYEVSATLLDLMGVPVPKYFEGQSLLCKSNSDSSLLKNLEL